ncbi:ABC transporter permease subunit [Deinococcus pimensis]|uniref:ABC transporter permease subunit n=1 Tax=Deinococcus pimensis TaxID=309888 RepID=UPI0004863C59|nr:ABC transporter permease subunit [Deinococcus pimensis]
MTIPLRSAKPPQGGSGFAIAVVVLLVLVGVSGLLAWGVSSLLAAQFPTLPAWTLLLLVIVALVPGMFVVARAFPWITNWYYLLPAIVVLAAFTVFPIVYTVNFAFTNYSGINSGFPDTSYKTTVALSQDRRTVTFSEVPGDVSSIEQLLGCAQGGGSCRGRPIALYDEEGINPVTYTVQSVQGRAVTLTAPVAAAFVATDATRVNTYGYVALAQFQRIFARASAALWPVFGWTVIFAASTIVINAVAGLVLGILLNNKRLKFRNFYRTLLFLPWAIPTVISIPMWGALLNQQFGIVNKTLGLLGAVPIPWLNDALWIKMAILLVNLWLGFPYMMTATIAALSTIPDELYEAADIDGASRLQQIRSITLPLLRGAFTPILLSGFAFNFNNFGIVYLLTPTPPTIEGRESTASAADILLSWGYRVAFSANGGQDFGLASAIAVIIGILTIGISVINFRAAGVFKEARR